MRTKKVSHASHGPDIFLSMANKRFRISQMSFPPAGSIFNLSNIKATLN